MGVQQASMIIGSDVNNNRRKMDFYPTPREVTIALLDFLDIPSWVKIWEPACGKNHMVDVMRERGYEVIGTDIQGGVDFLTADLPEYVGYIITNPPFNVSESFIKRCIQHGKPFALLLKSQYWHAARRSRLFYEYPPTYILPLTWRPDFTGKGSSLMDVMWCVWNGDRNFGFSFYRPLPKPREKGRL